MVEQQDVIGWGLIGAGRHAGNRVAPAIVAAPNARLVGVVGRDPAKASAFAERFGARAYASSAALLADPAVQAVFLATPNDLHAPQTLEAAAAGRHVLCEKPMALSPDECRAMIDACRAAGVRLGIGFHLRQHDAHARARELLAAGALGQPIFARAQWAIARATVREGWWGRPEQAGAGILYGTGVHVIDLLRFVLGREVEAVAAWTDARPDRPLDSRVLALLRFAGGAEAVLVAARGLPYPDNDLVIHGPAGRLSARDAVWEDLGGFLEVVTEDGATRQAFADDQPAIRLYARQLERFGRAILGAADDPFVATGEDGLRAALVCEAIRRSSAEGRTVRVEPAG